MSLEVQRSVGRSTTMWASHPRSARRKEARRSSLPLSRGRTPLVASTKSLVVASTTCIECLS
eukprot:6049449-Pleurochrysis_carterae.AAC.1